MLNILQENVDLLESIDYQPKLFVIMKYRWSNGKAVRARHTAFSSRVQFPTVAIFFII